MLKKAIGLIGLLLMMTLCGCGSALSDVPKSPSEYLQHLGSKTVALVYRYDNGSVQTYCTAVWVGDNAILTAAHCVDGVVDATNKNINMHNHWIREHNADSEEQWPLEKHVEAIGMPIHFIMEDEVTNVFQEPTSWHLAHAAVIDYANDLALLHADGPVRLHYYAELADQPPAIGEPVEIVGHQRGLYWTYMRGTVSAYRNKMPIKFLGPFMQVQAPVYFGNSGGGCFDRDGKLIGIASFIASSPSASFFISLKSLRLFLDAHLIQHE